MKFPKKPIIAFTVIAFTLFLFLFNNSRAVNFQQHDRFNSDLRRIKELDALINQDVVKSRSGLLTYYDPLANNFAEVKNRQRELNKIPDFIDRQGQIEISKGIKALAEILKQKEQLLERFKSQNAILRNSLYYFPMLTASLVDKALQAGNRRLAHRFEDLLRDVLIYNFTGSEELVPKIQAQLGILLTTRNEYSLNVNNSELDGEIFHGKAIVRNKPKVDELVAKLLSIPTWQYIEEIYKVYNQYYREALRKANVYGLFLSLFFIGYVTIISGYIINKLRKSAQIVSAAKEKLQDSLSATRQAEEKFRKIFENSTDGIFQTTTDGRYLSANQTLARIYGYASVEDLMTNLSDIKGQLYVDLNRRGEFITAMQTSGAVSQFESQIYRKDGSIIWISENARAIEDADGFLLYYEGTVEDITERKKAEAALQTSESRLRMQQTALMELSMCQPIYIGNLNAALMEITETAARTLDVDRVAVWLYNEDRSKVRCLDLYELRTEQHSEGFELSIADYPSYFQGLEDVRLLAIDDAYNDPRTREFLTSYLIPLGIESFLDVPIRLGGRIVGMLYLEQVGKPRHWALEDQNFASYLAYMASLAMEASDRKQAEEALRCEREKVETLLLNILPAPIADRLKRQSGAIADSFDEVSVLFADIVGFTQIASRISATELVDLLNQIFSAFDQLAERHGLEKIKTIGDAYMVVSGLPMPRADHADAIAEMALDMQQEVAKLSATIGENLNIRIGINTGPVVAGVIGIRKFIYDLWGDTVNIASRMESQGIPGCIQITDTTYELLRHKYLFQQRGIIKIKGKGEMTTYLLTGRFSNSE